MISGTISHYRIISKLGAGGMGEVYLAEDTRLDRKVAIKLLLAESKADERARKRFIREAKAAAKLDHPNICVIHEVGEEDNCAFIVMQYIEGQTLAARIQSRTMQVRESLLLAVQVAEALTEAHACGIIHRDIKPQNIMITSRGQARVLDFGLAKTMRQTKMIDTEAETDSLLTSPGVVIGTMPYMSPEQVRGKSLDARTDIFSLGAVIYQSVSGRQPFVAESIAELTLAILTREPPPLARYSPGVPDELQRIITKALRKNREERYQSVENLLIDLKSLVEELALKAKRGRSLSPELGSGVPTTETKREPALDKWIINYTQNDVDTIREQILGTEATKRRSLVLAFIIVIVVLAGVIAWLSTGYARSAASESREKKLQVESGALKSRVDQIQQQLDAKTAKETNEAQTRADAQAKFDKLLPAVLNDNAGPAEVASFARMVYFLPNSRVELDSKPPDKLFRNWRVTTDSITETYTLVGGFVDGKWVVSSNLVAKSKHDD